MTDDHAEVGTWIHRPGWGVAHVLRPHSSYQFRGAEYARTLCGRSVRTDQLTDAGHGDRCCRCAGVVVSLRAEARAREA